MRPPHATIRIAQSTIRNLLPLLFTLTLLCLPSIPCARAQDIPDWDCRVTVLVRTFDSPDAADPAGRLAAELVAAALQEGGLVAPVRPEQRQTTDWQFAPGAVQIGNADNRSDARHSRSVDVNSLPVATAGVEDGPVPPNDYRVEGVAAPAEDGWRVRLSLRNSATGVELRAASAGGKGGLGLAFACADAARQLEPVWRDEMLERRCEAALRAAAAEIVPPAAAQKRLAELHDRWPDAFAPLAARVALLKRSADTPPPELAAALRDLRDPLALAGLPQQRFLMRAGLDPKTLPEECRQAAEPPLAPAPIPPAPPAERTADIWKDVARIEQSLKRHQEAIAAAGSALALRPDDPAAHLIMADAFIALNRPPEAAAHLQKAIPQLPAGSEDRRRAESQLAALGLH